MIRRPHQTLEWTLALILVGCLAGATVVLAANLVLTPIGNSASAIANRNLPADQALTATAEAARVGQVAYLDALAATDPTTRGAAIDRAQQAGRTQDAEWATYLRLAGHNPPERPLQDVTKAAFNQSRTLGGVLIGSSPTDPTYAANLANERTQSTIGISLLYKIQTKYYEPVVRNGHARRGLRRLQRPFDDPDRNCRRLPRLPRNRRGHGATGTTRRPDRYPRGPHPRRRDSPKRDRDPPPTGPRDGSVRRRHL